MAICGVCKNTSNDESDVKCSGLCGYVFHPDCIKGEFEKKTRSCKEYKCKECRGASTQSSTKSSASNTNVLTKDFLLKVMEGFKTDVFAEINSFRTDINELSASMQFVSDKMDSSFKLIEQLTSQFNQLKKENEEIRSKNVHLSCEVRDLREKVRHLEQYSRINNIEINGVPATKEESVFDLLRDVGASIGVEVQECDISAAHRVPSFRRDRDPALIVQFTNRRMRDEWISKYRQKKSLTASEINQRFSNQRVFINDHLTPDNKQLLSKLKKKCREIGYDFAWCRDAKFFARKEPGAPVKKITCLEDIEALK